MRWSTTLVIGLLLLSPGRAAEAEADSLDGTGYLLISTDSLGTPIYIDGVFIGLTPIPKPVPVLAGIHEVGYLPPETRRSFPSARLNEYWKRVFVPLHDTLEVKLYYSLEYHQLRALAREQRVSTYVGIGLLGVVLLILGILAG